MTNKIESMNPDIKKRWLEALRSGEYEQGREALCSDGKYCCLGVLSDLAVEDGIAKWQAPQNYSYSNDYSIAGESAFLTDSIALWAGLSSVEPSVIFEGQEKCLHELNDGDFATNCKREPLNFNELADLIEEQL